MAYLRVSRNTVKNLIRDGKLPALRVGHQWRFKREDIDCLLFRGDEGE